LIAKRIATALLAPAAAFATRAEGFRRAWAHARFASSIRGKLDSSVVILGVPEVHGTGRIALGRNLFLYRELYFETQQEGSVEIGDNVVISRGAHLVSFAHIRIGADSLIGEYSSLRDANHRIGEGAVRNSGHTATPIEIGRNVWIGRGVTVLGGVRIGDNAVIGANAVVTRDVAPGAVVAGVPARPLHTAAGVS
jgi:acetyltransferase-like isoleucine patch superfamily enzyme